MASAVRLWRWLVPTVEGIDLEEPLIARTNADAVKAGLESSCSFRQVEIGPLPFDNGEFDIVASSGALTQTENKAAMFAEILRVLRSGGWVTVYDWMKSDGDYSEDMLYWFKMEELTYAMVTQEEQEVLIRQAGFVNVESVDAIDWYRKEARREYELMRGDLYARMVELIGEEEAEHFVEDWRSMVVVIDKGEMRQAYCRGQKPHSHW